MEVFPYNSRQTHFKTENVLKYHFEVISSFMQLNMEIQFSTEHFIQKPKNIGRAFECQKKAFDKSQVNLGIMKKPKMTEKHFQETVRLTANVCLI